MNYISFSMDDENCYGGVQKTRRQKPRREDHEVKDKKRDKSKKKDWTIQRNNKRGYNDE